jgi:hypothetical protein
MFSVYSISFISCHVCSKISGILCRCLMFCFENNTFSAIYLLGAILHNSLNYFYILPKVFHMAENKNTSSVIGSV